MHPSNLCGLLVLGISLMGVTQAHDQQTCKPALAISGAHYSAMQLPKLERTWTALVSVEASRCATSSGSFEIVYSMEKENALDFEFRERFLWRPGTIKVSKDFWADEAVAAYRVDNVEPCPCR